MLLQGKPFKVKIEKNCVKVEIFDGPMKYKIVLRNMSSAAIHGLIFNGEIKVKTSNDFF